MPFLVPFSLVVIPSAPFNPKEKYAGIPPRFALDSTLEWGSISQLKIRAKLFMDVFKVGISEIFFLTTDFNDRSLV